MKLGFALWVGLALLSTVSGARAATGICDSNPPTSSQACIDQIQSAGAVVNDIFKDANGVTGPNLPVFGKLVNPFPGCDPQSFSSCPGESNAPYACPDNYICNTTVANTFANAAKYSEALDHIWWHPCRISNHSLVNGCPVRNSCVADGDTTGYYPWEGLVFDLGGPSNQVVIFAQNDHGPQPCESVEYTVYLSDNPLSQELIDDPATTGTDPQKWNRAVLKKIYTWGWFTTRSPSPGDPTYAACGDTAQYAVEDDSFVQVHGLPCGITFRYTAIVAGYDGKEFPLCAYHSSEGEVDAIAGLTESGTGVCPDADKDGYVDCKCKGAPKVCDCADGDPQVHPGAPEPCDSAIDLNCDGNPGACPSGLFCYASVCVPPCKGGEIGNCPIGANCESTDQGNLCIASDCTTGGCPPGSVCDPATKTCKPACADVVCPYGQLCQDGKCVDPCASLQCPTPKQCVLGECKAPCNCFAGDIGCATGEVCDKGATNLCVLPACQGKTCAAGQHCDASGNCVGLCDGVNCPQGQKCVEPSGCVPLCDGVTCSPGQVCDEKTGSCVDEICSTPCIPPATCVAGKCVITDGGGGTGALDAGADASAGKGGSVKGGTTASGDDGGCGCRTPGRRSGLPIAGLSALALVWLGAWRAKRRRRNQPPR